jgi:hypothetical protein
MAVESGYVELGGRIFDSRPTALQELGQSERV